MNNISLLSDTKYKNIEDILLVNLIYGEFASSYCKPYLNLWFLSDGGKILPLHAYASWKTPLLKILYNTIADEVNYSLQYIPMVEGVVFQRRDIREVGKDNDELYFSTSDIYSGIERHEVYRVKNENPYITPYHLYIDDDQDIDGIRGLTREHILRIAFYGVGL
jgi:hypothetical protein